jgi:hypothetical protein
VFGLEADDYHALPNSDACPEHRDCPGRAQGAAASRGRRGADRAWDVLMLNAKRQAEEYARALPTSHGWPPFTQTMRFHLHPLGVRQNESIHQKLESHQASKGNPDSQQTLAQLHSWPTEGRNQKAATATKRRRLDEQEPEDIEQHRDTEVCKTSAEK